MATLNGQIWVVGGCDAWNPLSTVEIYDPEKNVWKAGPPMNSPRRGCGLVSKGGLLYVIGGSDGTQSLCTTEVYDPRINLWVAGPNMTVCRGNVSCAVLGDTIWAIGGFSGKNFLNSMEYLDPARDEWTTFIKLAEEDEEKSNGTNGVVDINNTGDESGKTGANKVFVIEDSCSSEEEQKRSLIPNCGN